MRSKHQRQFVHIALVLPTEFDYARGVLRGIIAATRERNLYTAGLPDSPRRAGLPWLFRVYRGIYGHSSKYLVRWFEDWNPDGIICQIYDDRLAKVYRDTGKPVIELFESRPESEFPRILPDDVATGELAARHFLERGFRHFAFFGAPWMLWSREREAGFRAEIHREMRRRAEMAGESNIDSTFTLNTYGSKDRPRAAAFAGSHGRRAAAMGEWLNSLPKPVALFSVNDLWGFELLQAARESGLHVPEDVAILGVDNEELLCEIAHPPLSSIRIGGEQMGRLAVSLLDDLLHRKKAAQEISRVPPMEIVTRQSTDVLAVDDPDVALALRHIRQHAVEGLSVKQLLDTVPVNRRTLERRFVSVLGHTPLEEIRRVRLDRAKTLLQTDLPIYEVARRSGFATPEYLATSFVQAKGITPTAYRRQFTPRPRWQQLPPG
ncbi:MAG TPA: substrate-binding domain-containing protein [Tepidisphaeraceae bacterium]|nr:substrate-binding domain-containing protein [Tepidisphaeraceae bacterium]